MPTANISDSSDVRDNIIAVGQRLIGARGFSAVGLNEILSEAGVPKGSFYHYFGSKDAFGVALLESYFEEYLDDMDRTLAQEGVDMARRLLDYFRIWQDTQSFHDCQGKCLAVKLGAEVADMSDAMRAALNRGTAAIVSRLARAIKTGVAGNSLAVEGEPQDVAQSLYQLWLGASIMVKIVRHTQPFEMAMKTTRQLLQLTP